MERPAAQGNRDRPVLDAGRTGPPRRLLHIRQMDPRARKILGRAARALQATGTTCTNSSTPSPACSSSRPPGARPKPSNASRHTSSPRSSAACARSSTQPTRPSPEPAAAAWASAPIKPTVAAGREAAPSRAEQPHGGPHARASASSTRSGTATASIEESARAVPVIKVSEFGVRAGAVRGQNLLPGRR